MESVRMMRNLLTLFAFFLAVTAAHAVTVSNSVSSVTATATGTTINVSSAIGTPTAGTFERIWVYTQTAAQAAQGTVANPAYPYGFTAVPVQRFSDTGGANTSGSTTINSLGAGSRIYILIAKFSSGTGAHISSTSGSLDFQGLIPQVVTITPSAAIIHIGENVVLTASGGHTTYQWSATGNAAGLAYDKASGIVSGSAVGSFVVTVWATATSTYSASNHAECVINVIEREEGSGDHSATVTFDNRARNYPVRFNVWQNGEVVYTEVVGGGKLVQKKIKLPSDAAYTVTAVIKDPILSPDGVWTEGQEKEVVVGTGTPGGSQDGTAPPEPEDPEEPSEPDIETDPIGFFQKKVQGYIDTALTKSQEIGEKAEERGKYMTDHFPAPTHTAPTYTPESGTIALGTHGGKALSILKNPFDPAGPFGGVLSSVAALVKRIIAWSAVVGFLYFFFDRIYRVVADANQTTSIPSVISDGLSNAAAGIGNVVSIPARVILCVALATIALGFPVILFTALKVGLPFSEIRSTFSTGIQPATMISAGGSMLQKAWALSGLVVPWDVLLAVPLWAFFVRMVILPKLLFWQL
ncbi:MAG TPA: hypothetical protein VK968_07680, partial [Roseimicrobium sp.]|nr:hypothetical protein [Roseimicrobium sp.]